MKIVIFGASGRTGRLLVHQALEQGHQVVAYVRRESAVSNNHPNLKFLVGELNSTAQLHAAIKGADACISVLGSNSIRKRNPKIIKGIDKIISVMEDEGVTRFIYLSSIGVGNSKYMMPPLLRFIIGSVILRMPFADHAQNESRIEASTLKWTIVRPGGLTDGDLVSNLQYNAENQQLSGPPKISRASVAAFILSLITDASSLMKAIWVYE